MKRIHINKRILIKAGVAILLLVASVSLYSEKIANLEKNDGAFHLSSSTSDGLSPTETATKTGTSVKEEKIFIIDVGGAVNRAGIVRLPEGSRVYEAIDAAGGFSDEADPRQLNLAAQLEDGEKLWVSTKEEAANQQTGSNTGFTNNLQMGRNAGKIDLNQASSEQLQELSGVGPATAEKIIAYREETGRFRKIEDLKNVSGIGEKSFEKLKNKICVN